ncbi:MAG TPA: hypothetical protein V6C95_02565 [Coleofasciculaceae cyanobacterium]
MDYFSLIYRNFWLIAISVGIINSVIIRVKILSKIKKKPELQDEGNQLIRGYFLATTCPWLILGIFQNIGNFSDIFYIYSGDYANQYVILSRSFIIFCILLYTYWIVLRNGAETLIKFECVRGTSNARFFKFITVVSATVGILPLMLIPRWF